MASRSPKAMRSKRRITNNATHKTSKKVARSKKQKGRKAAKRKPKPIPRRTPAQMRAARQEYKRQRKLVQPLVFFRIPGAQRMSKQWERKLKIYYDHVVGSGDVQGLTAGLRERIAIKDRRKLMKAQQEQGQGELPGFRYVWIQTYTDDDGEPLPVRYEPSDDEDEPDSFIVGDTQGRNFLFDKRALAKDPAGEVQRVLALAEQYVPEDSAHHFRVMCGQNTSADALLGQSILARVRMWMNSYQSRPHHWRDWLLGVTLYVAEDQIGLRDMARHREERRERRERLQQMNLNHARLTLILRSLGKMTNVEAVQREWDRLYTGISYEVASALGNMRKEGLVNGDNSKWMLTAKGRALGIEYQGLSDFMR